MELIETYLTLYRAGGYGQSNKNLDWAWEAMDKRRSPEDLPLIFDLLQACENDAEIAYVAAGPLKNLFYEHHLEIKESLMVMVRKNKIMRKAVQALIFSSDSAYRQTLNEILNKYRLQYASL